MHVRMTPASPRPIRDRLLRSPVLAGALMALLAAGCSIQFGPRPGSSTNRTTITVRMVNKTNKPLDPQVFVGAIANGRDQLFASINKRTDFGFATTGLIASNDQAEFTFDCGSPSYVGTEGGIYGDNLTSPIAQGQTKILEEGASVSCGDLITFTYTASGGPLVTSYTVEPQ